MQDLRRSLDFWRMVVVLFFLLRVIVRYKKQDCMIRKTKLPKMLTRCLNRTKLSVTVFFHSTALPFFTRESTMPIGNVLAFH